MVSLILAGLPGKVKGFLVSRIYGVLFSHCYMGTQMDGLLKMAELFLEAAVHPRANYMREYMKNRYHNTRRDIADRLGGKCARCGSAKGPWHFDHIDKKKKSMRAADLHSVNDKKFESEIKNLQLLCADCHKEKTREAWDYNVPKPRHGTYWGYRKYNCRCPECVKAYKEKQKEWRAKTK